LNVSPLTLDTAEWLPLLAAHLGARRGIAARLIVEVTETAAIRDPRATRRSLEAMKALGVSLAIDDFGSGHTSFRHLRDFPVDFLKLDGAFIQNVAERPEDGYFVRTLIDLARHLGIETVAEWVESEKAAVLLAGWGVDYLQGDHCGPPVLAPRAAAAPAPAAAA
jgi:EAL domain-containing protein (putative c-di-GMP-specific phosphodiesterase class I)